MAKELPYFKFNPSEWISGNITLEDFYTQGVFVNICALYWFKSGCLKTSEIKPRLKCKQSAIDELLEKSIIKTHGEFVIIDFLLEQLDERGLNSKKNSLNGSSGGAPIGNKNAQKNKPPLDLEQPQTSNIEKNKNKNKNREESIAIANLVVLEPLPFNENFRAAWGEWLAYKIEKKQKLTPTTKTMQLRTLGAKSEQEAIGMIAQSITNGWTGLFELKSQTNGKGLDTAEALRAIYRAD